MGGEISRGPSKKIRIGETAVWKKHTITRGYADHFRENRKGSNTLLLSHRHMHMHTHTHKDPATSKVYELLRQKPDQDDVEEARKD